MRALAIALLLPWLAACREEPLPPVAHVESARKAALEPFLDMDIRLSVEAQAAAREAVEGFFARKAMQARIEYSVMAGVANETGEWPLLLFVCVRDITDAPTETRRYVVALTSSFDGRFLTVAEMLGSPLFGRGTWNASYPAALTARVQSCLRVPASGAS
jgi:hypothetical protein